MKTKDNILKNHDTNKKCGLKGHSVDLQTKDVT